MNIMSSHMKSELITPVTRCCVCDEDFQPVDDLEFVCIKCRNELKGGCGGCGYDDVVMDWGIELDGDLPYFWQIDCLCGRTLKSRLHSVDDINQTAKEIHAQWTGRDGAKRAESESE